MRPSTWSSIDAPSADEIFHRRDLRQASLRHRRPSTDEIFDKGDWQDLRQTRSSTYKNFNRRGHRQASFRQTKSSTDKAFDWRDLRQTIYSTGKIFDRQELRQTRPSSDQLSTELSIDKPSTDKPSTDKIFDIRDVWQTRSLTDEAINKRNLLVFRHSKESTPSSGMVKQNFWISLLVSWRKRRPAVSFYHPHAFGSKLVPQISSFFFLGSQYHLV